MKFKTSPVNRAVRVLAALILLSVGTAGLVATPMPAALIGAAIAVIGCSVLVRELLEYGRELWRRRDRYDLAQLDETPLYKGPSRDDPGAASSETPSWDSEEGDVVYCHHCDVSMCTTHSVCPKCGRWLGS